MHLNPDWKTEQVQNNNNTLLKSFRNHFSRTPAVGVVSFERTKFQTPSRLFTSRVSDSRGYSRPVVCVSLPPNIMKPNIKLKIYWLCCMTFRRKPFFCTKQNKTSPSTHTHNKANHAKWQAQFVNNILPREQSRRGPRWPHEMCNKSNNNKTPRWGREKKQSQNTGWFLLKFAAICFFRRFDKSWKCVWIWNLTWS